MDARKRKRLEEAGWTVGSAEEFLGLSPEEAAFVELKVELSRTLRERRAKRRAHASAVGEAPRVQSVARGEDGSERSFGVSGPLSACPPRDWGVSEGDRFCRRFRAPKPSCLTPKFSRMRRRRNSAPAPEPGAACRLQRYVRRSGREDAWSGALSTVPRGQPKRCCSICRSSRRSPRVATASEAVAEVSCAAQRCTSDAWNSHRSAVDADCREDPDDQGAAAMATPKIAVAAGEDSVVELSYHTCAGQLVRLLRDVQRSAQPNAKVQPHAAPTQLSAATTPWRRMSAATPR
jgi:hypothetical protein